MAECGCVAPALGPPLTNTCGGGSFIFFMAVVDALLRNKCEVSELCARNDPILEPDSEYDFIVIGGGAGGAAAAGRLAQVEGQKVLLIEAGMDEPAGTQIPSMTTNYLGSDIDFSFKTEPEPVACQGYPEKRCTWPIGKVLGGTGVIHGMMYMRGLPYDYDTWAELGNDGWSFEDVLPIFKRFENNLEVGTLVSDEDHGTDGPVTVVRFGHQPQAAWDILKGAEEAGYPVRDDLNSENRDGFVVAQANVNGQARQSSARAYVRPQRDNENFHLMLNSTATKIILDDQDGQKRAVAVELVYGNTTYTVQATKEIIVAAGAVSTPKLLLLSGIGPADELAALGIDPVHDLPGVGKNLMNHVSFHLNYFSNKIADSDELTWEAVSEFLQHSTGPLASPGLSQVTARLSTDHNDVPGSPDLQMFFGGYKANCSTGENTNLNSGKWIQISPVALRPKSRGYLTLRSSDPNDPPLIYANYLTEQYDVDVLVDGVRIAQNLVDSPTLRAKYDLVLHERDYGNCGTDFEYDSDEFWACAVKSETEPENHQSSTAKMGPESDPTAVVNNKLQVYGIDNLRVMDASVMPFMVSGNPHASVVLIAEKGVDLVLESWGLSAKKSV